MKPVCLVIMDGVGSSDNKEGNAFATANTPTLDNLSATYPTTTLDPKGRSVGLPSGQMGNSEVGHLTIGAGRVIFQDLTRINIAAEGGEFFQDPLFKEAIAGLIKSGSALHLMGLVSDGGVHSHNTHLYALVSAAKELGLDNIFIHAFLDGRDTDPKSGIGFIEELEEKLATIGAGRIATVTGRYYAMDRDKRWDRVEMAYNAMTSSIGERAGSAIEAVKKSYARGETDEFVLPTVIIDGTDGGEPVGPVSDDDVLFFFNFRADRAREITSAFILPCFDGFELAVRPKLKSFLCMTEYDANFKLPVIFPPEELKNILPEILSRAGIKQFRVSETEKYAHVTFFFNGGVEEPFAGEERSLIPSVRDVDTYDLAPRMRAAEIARAATERISEGRDGFILMNFANGDMVGHTGNFSAAVAACEAVDKAVGEVVAAACEKGFTVMITSDHGNAEEMFGCDPAKPITAHSTNPVPFILVDDAFKGRSLREGGGLKDIAPTVLEIMGIEKPIQMDGESLLV